MSHARADGHGRLRSMPARYTLYVHTADVTSTVRRDIERSVARMAEEAGRPLVLAVSGGLDSMVLLDVAARVAHERIAVVATFDHGSGSHSAAAAAFVSREGGWRRLPVVIGRAGRLPCAEAAWRDARWRFLRGAARQVKGVVLTAHTEDDQVETVFMRAMRGAGARGLAGLHAPSGDVLRPFIGVRRPVLERYARERGVAWLADPTNADLRHFRNRVRHELLPALLRARPGLDEELLELSLLAAGLRAEVDAVAATILANAPPAASVARRGVHAGLSSVSVAVEDLAGYDAESLAILWPAIAARVGLALDWRGTRRVVAFTTSDRAGASMQLAGGWEVMRDRQRLTLRRQQGGPPAPADLPRSGALHWGRWSFVRTGRRGAGGAWQAVLPRDCQLLVRAWRPGDRMVGSGGMPRRVKRFFGDAGIAGPARVGWPVVLAGEEIVWIPGVGRSGAVAGSPGTSGLIYFCELNDR